MNLKWFGEKLYYEVSILALPDIPVTAPAREGGNRIINVNRRPATHASVILEENRK